MGSSLPLTLSPQINADLRAKNDPLITRIARNEEKEKNANDLYSKKNEQLWLNSFFE